MERNPQEIIAELTAQRDAAIAKLKELKHAAVADPIIRYYRGAELFRLMDEMKAILSHAPVGIKIVAESTDKHSADVDPVLDYINQHTTLRHMTPPFTEQVEMEADTLRCGCGDEAAYYRAGKHFCSECLIESGDLE